MAKIYRRDDTSVWYADYTDRFGNRQRKSTRTRDAQVARVRAREFELELATPDRPTHETETLGVALDYFVDVTHASSPKGTVDCYRQKARHLSNHLGSKPLDKLTAEDVERYIGTRIKEGAHTHSIHKELVVLRGTLKAARKRGRFHGPHDLVPQYDAQYEPKKSYLTADQFLKLCEHIAPRRENLKPGPLARWEARRNNRALYCLVITLASPRRNEIELLEWPDVDLKRNTIRIPKSKTVGRTVKIHPVLRPWLEALHRGTGRVVRPWGNIIRDLERACARAGVPKSTPNDLRRTFASWLVQAGVSLYVVSRLLGHNSTRMVEMVYGQLDEATLEAAIAKLPDGGVTNGVTTGVPRIDVTGERRHQKSVIKNTRKQAKSSKTKVPRVGIEPTTRGFSVLVKMAPKGPSSHDF